MGLTKGTVRRAFAWWQGPREATSSSSRRCVARKPSACPAVASCPGIASSSEIGVLCARPSMSDEPGPRDTESSRSSRILRQASMSSTPWHHPGEIKHSDSYNLPHSSTLAAEPKLEQHTGTSAC
eukprot:2426889-Rhodomonas_salina.1